jgi:ComF family protein
MEIRFPVPENPARSLSSLFLDFLFPPRCVYCRKTGQRICDRCAGEISWIDSHQCARCGLPRGEPRNHRCIERGHLHFIRSAAVFSGAMRKALHALKYSSDRFLADELIRLSHPHWALPTWDFDFLLPVPLGKERQRARGYNQSLLLANALSRVVHIPVAEDSLQRVRETQSQVGLSYGARKQNMADAFRASSVEGKKVLLVDDVCTTGATLQSCAAALAEAEAGRIGALTLARAPTPGVRQDAYFLSHGGIHDHSNSCQRIRDGDDPAPEGIR